MSLTFTEIKYQLSLLDEVLVLEILEITATEIVDRFEDRIEEKLDYIIEGLGGDTDELS